MKTEPKTFIRLLIAPERAQANDTNPWNGRLFRPFQGLVSRAGLAGGRAQNQDSCRPALTHSSWVNTKAGWYHLPPHEKAENQMYIFNYELTETKIRNYFKALYDQ